MEYVREYHLQSCHFNDEAQYQVIYNEPASEWHKVLPHIHGHNFRVVVEVYRILGDKDWIISDVDLEAVVMEWNNCNLSVHNDFYRHRFRATTERMAELLHAKLERRFVDCNFRVTIHETPFIYATAE